MYNPELKHITCTKGEYDAMKSHPASTLYFLYDTQQLFKGDIEWCPKVQPEPPIIPPIYRIETTLTEDYKAVTVEDAEIIFDHLFNGEFIYCIVSRVAPIHGQGNDMGYFLYLTQYNPLRDDILGIGFHYVNYMGRPKDVFFRINSEGKLQSDQSFEF